MTPNEKIITTFETRVRQMLLRFLELKKENEELYAMVEKAEQEAARLQARLDQAERDYAALKTARMMEITDGDLQGAKDRVARMIRDVNKCIAVLTDENQ